MIIKPHNTPKEALWGKRGDHAYYVIFCDVKKRRQITEVICLFFRGCLGIVTV